MRTEEEIRKEWKDYFMLNKHRFTSSKREAEKDSNLIYVEKEIDNMRHGRDAYFHIVDESNFLRGLEG